MLVAGIVWALMLALYAAKWIYAREEALRELEHPVQCCFVGLVGVATMLISIAALPYSRLAAQIAFAVGASFTLAFAVWRTGLLWRCGRDPGTTTPVLYPPTVAGAFVTATAAAALGHRDWGQLAFGAGLFSWLAIESVLLRDEHRGDADEPHEAALNRMLELLQRLFARVNPFACVKNQHERPNDPGD